MATFVAALAASYAIRGLAQQALLAPARDRRLETFEIEDGVGIHLPNFFLVVFEKKSKTGRHSMDQVTEHL